MIHYLSKTLLRLLGWKSIISIDEPAKSVVCIAPHTSNCDFLIGQLFSLAWNRKYSFLMKKDWFFFPLGSVFRALGGIPVDRSRKNSLTDLLVEEFESRSYFHLAITPEGTRGLVHDWKMGFYYIALKAQVPIQLAYIDYSKKEVGITKLFYPTGNEQADLAEIQSYFRGRVARHPEKFNLSK
jgi:1-acyl-sn-glycerol-3-phosphate acyltransferase